MQALIDIPQRSAAFKQAFAVAVPRKGVRARRAWHQRSEFADHFFNDVIQRHQTLDLAVFIDDETKSLMIFLKILQLREYVRVLEEKIQFSQQSPKNSCSQILFMRE